MPDSLIELFLFDIVVATEEDKVWDEIHKQLHSFKKLFSSKIQLIDASLNQDILDAMIEENSYLDFDVDELKALNDAKLLPLLPDAL